MKRLTATIILPAFCAVFLSCSCLDLCASTITYEVDGWATRTSVLYHNEFGDAEYFSSIRLPWVKTFSVEYRDAEHHGGVAGDFFPAYIEAQIMEGRGGYLTVSIYVNGELVKRDSTSGARLAATAWAAVKM
jgi:hypothetical protein